MSERQSESTGPRLRTSEDYRESLRDGRRIFYRGEAVDDVPSHEVFRHAVNHAALDYEMAENPTYRDLAVKNGYSRSTVVAAFLSRFRVSLGTTNCSYATSTSTEAQGA